MYDELIGELYLTASNVQSKNKRELLERAASAIEDLKTTAADVRPVVKAEWLPFGKRGIYGMMYACSSCRAKYDGKTNYCPNCGAMMEES